MPELIITGGDREDVKEAKEEVELKFEATEEDEERFFLMYHLHFQPTEVESLDPDYRRWIIARFMGQKKMEHEMREQQRLMHQLGPNIGNGGPSGLIHR